MKLCPICSDPSPPGYRTCGRSECQQADCATNVARNARGRKVGGLMVEAARLQPEGHRSMKARYFCGLCGQEILDDLRKDPLTDVPVHGKCLAAAKKGGQRIVETHAETATLYQSERACAVADAWVEARQRSEPFRTLVGAMPSGMVEKLDRLEEATRTSELRKVKP